MSYNKTIVVRCSAKLKRAVALWAKSHNAKPTDVTRRVLEVAFGVDEELPIPPGVKRVVPSSTTPVRGIGRVVTDGDE